MLADIDLKERKDIIFVIVVCVITIFVSRNIWDAQKAKLNSVKKKIKTHEQTIGLVEEIEILSNKAKKFRGVGWPSKESVIIMREVNKIATKYNIEISSFDPGSLKGSKYYFTLPLNLNIVADYISLVRFLSAVEKLKFLTKIRVLQIKPVLGSNSELGGPIVSAYVSIETYMLKD